MKRITSLNNIKKFRRVYYKRNANVKYRRKNDISSKNINILWLPKAHCRVPQKDLSYKNLNIKG